MSEHKPPFLVEYRHRGRTYGCTVGGDSWAEAEAHLKSIGANGRIIGSNVSTYRVNDFNRPLLAFWVPLLTWWRNLWR